MQTKTRVVGSGFTSFNYAGRPIAFLDRVQDTGQTAISSGGQPFEPIYPIGSKRAVEIATSRVLGVGTLTLTIRELWNEDIWEQLVGLAGTTDQTQVFDRLASLPGETTCQSIIKPPGSPTWRGKVYHGCVVTGIDDGETIDVGALTVAKTITVTYTHKTRLVQPASAL